MQSADVVSIVLVTTYTCTTIQRLINWNKRYTPLAIQMGSCEQVRLSKHWFTNKQTRTGGEITMSEVTRSGHDGDATKFMKTKAYPGNHSNPKWKLPACLSDEVQGINVYKRLSREDESYLEPS
jgi:hypothetical protein